jgi:hypothetical protein
MNEYRAMTEGPVTLRANENRRVSVTLPVGKDGRLRLRPEQRERFSEHLGELVAAGELVELSPA